MTYEKILKGLKSNKMSAEEALINLSNIGMCPSVVNSDNSQWAVTFDRMQSVSKEKNAEDVYVAFFIEARCWKDSIKEAIIWSMEN